VSTPSNIEASNADAPVSALEWQLLCAFLQETTQLNPHGKPGPQLTELVRSIFRLEAVAIYDADLREIYPFGEWFDDLEEVLQNICVFESSSEDKETGLIRRVLRMGRLPIGAMQLRGEMNALTADAIAAIIAITFDRYHAFANESRIESARQAELLRTTVLDSLAHAYKTPLTAIEAASSGLAAMGKLSPAQAGLVALIEEQAAQLAQLTNQLLMTARLETSDLVPRMTVVSIAPLIDDVVASLAPQLADFTIDVTMSRDDLALKCDRSLIVALLTQYLDNASKYADVGSHIAIQVEGQSDAIVFSMHSFGPIIPSGDHSRIFDRYYRSSNSAGNAPGTGLGLSIAKRAAQAHRGHVWVTSDRRKGTVFYASFPRNPEATPVHE
jgi:two-component system sensor histidine kinase KdpD